MLYSHSLFDCIYGGRGASNPLALLLLVQVRGNLSIVSQWLIPPMAPCLSHSKKKIGLDSLWCWKAKKVAMIHSDI